MTENIRVLLVDDHPLMLIGISSMLEGKGIDIVGTAGNGFEALEKAAQLKPDVMLLDIVMPGMDGIELARRMRAENCVSDRRFAAPAVFCNLVITNNLPKTDWVNWHNRFCVSC